MGIKQSFNFLLMCADNDNITGGPPRELSTLFPGRQGKGDCLPCNFCPWLRKMVYLKETRRMNTGIFPSMSFRM